MKAAVLISHDAETGSCVIGVPNEHGGQTELALDPPFSAPQFLPEVGEPVLLTMDGPVPRILPQQLGVDSVGVEALQFDVITAILFYGATIVFGDPDGNHGILDSTGWRLVKDGADETVNFDTATGDALITGVIRSALTSARSEFGVHGGGHGLAFYPTVGTLAGGLTSTSTETGVGRFFVVLTLKGSPNGDAVAYTQYHPEEATFGYATDTTTDPDTGFFVRADVDGLHLDAAKIGAYGATPVVKPTVTGSRGGNAALASLLTALASQGILTDSSTA